jgi:hypothetical protein
MKANTTKQYPYNGDYYGYTVTTSEDGTVTETKYNEYFTVVPMSLSISLIGELLIESQSKMQRNGYVKNIRDANGDEIYTDGVWQIIQTAPLLGPLGLKDGYKYRAQIISGDI